MENSNSHHIKSCSAILKQTVHKLTKDPLGYFAMLGWIYVLMINSVSVSSPAFYRFVCKIELTRKWRETFYRKCVSSEKGWLALIQFWISLKNVMDLLHTEKESSDPAQTKHAFLKSTVGINLWGIWGDWKIYLSSSLRFTIDNRFLSPQSKPLLWSQHRTNINKSHYSTAQTQHYTDSIALRKSHIKKSISRLDKAEQLIRLH